MVSAYTGVLMCDFDELHAYIEELMQRPVWTHELADDEIQKQIAELAKPEFLLICASQQAGKEKSGREEM